MDENKDTQFDEFENVIRERRKLLPFWIKIFCWIFMIFGILSMLSLIFGAFGGEADLSFYGFQTNQPLSLVGLSIIAVLTLKGFTAYALWFEKDYAITLGKIDAVVGIVICIASMCNIAFIRENSMINIRFELFLLIPYYMKLSKIEDLWKTRKIS